MSGENTPRRSSEISTQDHQPGQDATPTQSQSSSAHFGSASQMSDGTRRRPPVVGAQTEGYGTINPAPRTPRESAQRPRPSRRSTSVHMPHKGQEFSVDDDEDEVDQELERQRLLEREERKLTRMNTLKRQASTVRRRPAAQPPALAKVDSADDDELPQIRPERTLSPPPPPLLPPPPQQEILTSGGEETLLGEESSPEPPDEEEEEAVVNDEDDSGDVSDAESFTLKDRQQAINDTHPFGIRIWKPALYKKGRSVQRNAEADIHSAPGGHVRPWLVVFNYLWMFLFGWWLGLLCFIGALVCVLTSFFSSPAMGYAVLLWGLGRYLIYPFGKFVTLVQDEAYAEEDDGEGRSITEYEQWQSGDIEEGRLFFGPLHINRSLIGRRRTSVESADETQSLLGRTGRNASSAATGQGQARTKRRIFGRGQWNVGRIVFYLYFYGIITPPLMLVSAIGWFFVFTIPMGKVTLLLFDHLRRHPLALSFHSAGRDVRQPDGPSRSVLLCTYRAAGLKYWKYTIDGTNIFIINLLALVVFAIVDYFVLHEALGINTWFTGDAFVFVIALLSIMPLAYFIGQAVASISAQSSMGLGAAVNAFFSTVVEVFLYCVALKEGKHQLVEGSIIGSIFAGILLLPGLSMCFGALKRKTQRFNVKSAGVTSTMLLFAMIGAFSPTLFYQIYGSHELKCTECIPRAKGDDDEDCRRCFFAQIPAVHDSFYQQAVLPYVYVASVTLFLSYVIGLLFTLRTHAAIIWNSELDEKKAISGDATIVSSTPSQPMAASQDRLHLTRQTTAGSIDRSPQDVRSSALYQRILGHSLRQAGMQTPSSDIPGTVKISRPGPAASSDSEPTGVKSPHIVPPKSRDGSENPNAFHLQGLSDADNRALIREVAELAATAATVAARDAQQRPHHYRTGTAGRGQRPHVHVSTAQEEQIQASGGAPEIGGQAAAGGHDAPNWGRSKSVIILLVATLAYAIIAEILVDTVDSVLDNVDIDEKFLGITLFALVPNTTEFLNAISFAMNGNIALSMEIGSAYALQVCLLQIPALVAYSAIWGRFVNPDDIVDHTFTLIFPQWDMVMVILCIFLLSYMYGEGKSNYFKGSILILSYFVVVVGFYFSSIDNADVNMKDTLALGISPLSPAWQSLKTNGFEMRGREL